MQQPEQLPPIEVAKDTFVLPGYLPLPGLGVLPTQSFLLRRGHESILIDTGPAPLSDAFMASLGSLIDFGDLAYLCLTHADPDHTGALRAVLESAPRAQVITTFLGAGKLALSGLLPPDRPTVIQPGDRVQCGEVELATMRPPTFDAPETVAYFEQKSGALFTADSFGALLDAPAERADAIVPARLREGMLGWVAIDVPWLEHVSRDTFRRKLSGYRQLPVSVVLSSHLPPAFGGPDQLLDVLEQVCVEATSPLAKAG